jgi:hypothetical protein
MQYKVAELEGVLLDAAVAKALGYESPSRVPEELCGKWYAGESDGGVKDWMPSTDWGQGGPIIERERIGVSTPFVHNPKAVVPPGYVDHTYWEAEIAYEYDQDRATSKHAEGEGRTPLIAAMRAYVASRFGEAIELP